jgi:hypothetical protein
VLIRLTRLRSLMDSSRPPHVLCWPLTKKADVLELHGSEDSTCGTDHSWCYVLE